MVYPLREPDSLEEVITKTSLKCGYCGDYLHLVEEAWELRIVQPEIGPENIIMRDALGPNGVGHYIPHFFEFMCWEKAEELLEELWEDVPPISDDFALLECDLCRSHIREWETMGLVRFGELHCSPRNPDGETSYQFEPMGTDRHICVGCLTHVNDELDLWEEGIEGMPGIEVCRDGIFERCWRKGKCNCTWRIE